MFLSKCFTLYSLCSFYFVVQRTYKNIIKQFLQKSIKQHGGECLQTYI